MATDLRSGTLHGSGSGARYPERSKRGEAGVLLPRSLFGSHFGRMQIDYARKVMERARFLTQPGRKSDGCDELKRLARHSEGRKYDRKFITASGKGYWRGYVLPKTNLGAGRGEYRGSLPMALASFGMQSQPQEIGVDAEAVPKIKGAPKKKLKLRNINKGAAGAQDVARLFPAGKRLLKPEWTYLWFAPRVVKGVFFWGWNSHGGCVR